jgi:F-type H+-transporting ATPase subunit delta
MQAASRESYTAALERLNESAAPDQIAEELFAVARLLAREPRLRRALADPARVDADRAELVRNVLAGKISDEALVPVETLVRGRWSSTSDLLEATERLAVEAVLASAELAGELGDVEDELFRFGQVVAGDPELAAVIADSTVDVARRAGLVRDLLGRKARPATVRLVEVALHGFGGRGFQASLTRLVELAADRRDNQLAYVTAAVMPTEEEEQRLTSTLSERYGRQISLKISVKPEIIGGMSVRVGSDLYDGTVSRWLSEARGALTKGHG